MDSMWLVLTALALGIFLGVAMLSPFLSRPMVGGVGSVVAGQGLDPCQAVSDGAYRHVQPFRRLSGHR